MVWNAACASDTVLPVECTYGRTWTELKYNQKSCGSLKVTRYIHKYCSLIAGVGSYQSGSTFLGENAQAFSHKNYIGKSVPSLPASRWKNKREGLLGRLMYDTLMIH